MTLRTGILGCLLGMLPIGKGAVAQEWPFTDTKATAVFTTSEIIGGKAPILYVSRDGDGSWQFHSDGPADPTKAKVVGLGVIVNLDPSIKELADLPKGWVAERTSRKAKWVRSKDDRDGDE